MGKVAARALALILIVLIAVACAPSPTPTPLAPTSTPTPLPPTATPAPVGVVYFFFSTLCSACNAQAPIVEQFYRDNPNIRVVGVPLYATQEAAQAWAQSLGLDFEIREDKNLVNALGPQIRHPLVAFQSASGGTLVKASDGEIAEQALTESFQVFVTGGIVTPIRGVG